jgi:hypothetical protein
MDKLGIKEKREIKYLIIVPALADDSSQFEE